MVTKVVTIILVACAAPFIAAWFAMIWLGVAHSFDERVPAFGFWTTFFLVWALCAPVHLATHDFKDN